MITVFHSNGDYGMGGEATPWNDCRVFGARLVFLQLRRALMANQGMNLTSHT